MIYDKNIAKEETYENFINYNMWTIDILKQKYHLNMVLELNEWYINEKIDYCNSVKWYYVIWNNNMISNKEYYNELYIKNTLSTINEIIKDEFLFWLDLSIYLLENNDGFYSSLSNYILIHELQIFYDIDNFLKWMDKSDILYYINNNSQDINKFLYSFLNKDKTFSIDFLNMIKKNIIKYYPEHKKILDIIIFLINNINETSNILKHDYTLSKEEILNILK